MRAQGIHEKHICLVLYCLPEKLLLHNYRLGLCISLDGYMCVFPLQMYVSMSAVKRSLQLVSVCEHFTIENDFVVCILLAVKVDDIFSDDLYQS